MSVRVVFLGMLQDLAGVAEMSLPAPLVWRELLDLLPAPMSDHLRLDRVRIACNGRVLADKAQLAGRDGDEVALLPPVSGG